MNNKPIMFFSLAAAIILTVVFAVVMFRNGFVDSGEDKKNIDKSEVNSDSASQKDENISTEPDEFTSIELVEVSEVSSGVVSEKPPFQKISFVAVGDNIVHSSVYTDAKELAQGTDKEYNFVPMFENVADIISGADIAYINQESPFAGKEKTYSGYPMFNSPDQVGYDLMEIGFDVINLANNHMLDRYAAGYKRTIDFWKEQEGMTYIGGYENEEDYNDIRIVEKDGISIAFLSYTYGTNGVNLDRDSEMIIPLCDEAGTAEIDRQTKLAREKADIVMVSIHWGYEDWFEPSDLQERQMQVMVNNGVDVIIGTHPHVLQPMLWKDRPDGGRTLVMYSLGNFLSGMLYLRNMVGGIAGFDIVKAGDEVFVQNPYFIPTVCQYDTSWRGFKIYKFSEYTQELLKEHRTQRVSDTGKSLEYMRNIIDNAIPNEFLKEDFYREAE